MTGMRVTETLLSTYTCVMLLQTSLDCCFES